MASTTVRVAKAAGNVKDTVEVVQAGGNIVDAVSSGEDVSLGDVGRLAGAAAGGRGKKGDGEKLGAKAEAQKPPTEAPKGGPYSDLPDHPSVGEGKKFTQSQKNKVRDENQARNGGQLKSDVSGTELVPPQQHQKGVTPPSNEAHVDHITPRSQGGSNSNSNAQVISREEDLRKGANGQ